MPALFPSRGFRRTRERASGVLFALGVDDLSSTVPTGQTLTLTRTTGRTVFDSTGRVATLAHSQFPWSAAYNSAAAVWEPVVAIDRQSTNLVLQSENFGTTWSAIGTPTRTAAAAACGDLTLDLIGDDAAGTLEGYSQVVTFTGSATKAVSLFVKQGTSTSSVVRLRDTTASANRLLATITWSGGVPSVAMTTGTSLGQVACANGAYRLLFQTTSVTAANTNQVEIYPATTSGLATSNTGTLYVGGVQAQNWPWPRAYIRTTTGTATHNADELSSTIAFAPQDLTVYVRFAAPSFLAALTGLGGGLFQLGSIVSGAHLYAIVSSTGVGVTLSDGTTQVGPAAQALTASTWYDIAVQMRHATTTGAQAALDVGNGFGAFSSATGTFSAWGANTLWIGTVSDGSGPVYQIDSGIRRLTIASGLRTLDQMRGLAV